jgi:hypothetical protein
MVAATAESSIKSYYTCPYLSPPPGNWDKENAPSLTVAII